MNAYYCKHRTTSTPTPTLLGLKHLLRNMETDKSRFLCTGLANHVPCVGGKPSTGREPNDSRSRSSRGLAPHYPKSLLFTWCGGKSNIVVGSGPFGVCRATPINDPYGLHSNYSSPNIDNLGGFGTHVVPGFDSSQSTSSFDDMKNRTSTAALWMGNTAIRVLYLISARYPYHGRVPSTYPPFLIEGRCFYELGAYTIKSAQCYDGTLPKEGVDLALPMLGTSSRDGVNGVLRSELPILGFHTLSVAFRGGLRDLGDGYDRHHQLFDRET